MPVWGSAKQALLVAVAMACGSTAITPLALAADPNFCRDYAGAAVRQAREAWSIPPCRPNFESPRWTTEFRIHFDWCLTTSYDAANAERFARTRHLEHCR
jgi:hypothetical protein